MDRNVALSELQPVFADAGSLWRTGAAGSSPALSASMIGNSQAVRSSIGAHLDVTRPEVAGRVAGMTSAFEARGYDVGSATQAAERAMQGLVARQAAVLMFEKLFLVSGIAFLFVLPLLAFLKSL